MERGRRVGPPVRPGVRLTSRPRRLAVVLLAMLATLADAAAAPAGSPVVAVAANVGPAAAELAQRLRAATGLEVRLSIGASGTLARQIARGAPFELFLSADESFVEQLWAAGLAAGPGALYAIGRLALYVPPGSPLALPASRAAADEAVAALLRDRRLRRLAMANPEHAPYGRAAREALGHAGVWRRLQDRLVLGESVAQAARFAHSSSVDAALLPYSLVLRPAFARGRHALVPEHWHTPVRQRMVLLRGAGETARRLYRLVLSAEGRAVLRRHGYQAPASD